jgi:tetratricopeptide (TPR) repeat protein
VARFPKSPSALRALANVYATQAIAGGDSSVLLPQAESALRRAKALDPNDGATLLDLSQAARVAGDLTTATKYAMQASAHEAVRGPAHKALAALVTQKGRKALEAHEPEKAIALAKTARLADPASAAPDLLEGDAWVETHDDERFLKALERYRAAREREPASKEVATTLARFYRVRGAAWLTAAPPKPKGRDGGPPSADVLAKWQAAMAGRRANAIRDREEALRLDPDGPEAAATREALADLKATEPEAQRAAVQAAERLYTEGVALQQDGKTVDAFERLEEATAAWPSHLKAHVRAAEVGISLGATYDIRVLRHLEAARELDGEGRYSRVHFYFGQVFFRRFKGAKDDAAKTEAAEFCRKSLERYLGPARAAGAAEAKGVQAATAILESLTRDGF